MSKAAIKPPNQNKLENNLQACLLASNKSEAKWDETETQKSSFFAERIKIPKTVFSLTLHHFFLFSFKTLHFSCLFPTREYSRAALREVQFWKSMWSSSKTCCHWRQSNFCLTRRLICKKTASRETNFWIVRERIPRHGDKFALTCVSLNELSQLLRNKVELVVFLFLELLHSSAAVPPRLRS